TDWTDGGRLDLIIDELTTNCDAIEADTQDLQSQIGTAGAGLTDLGGMSAGMKAEINAEVDTALNTAIPGSPTANSINERIATLDDNYTAARAGYIDNINGHTAQTGDTYGALPTNFSDLAITASTGKVTVGTNSDKTGYSISGTKTTLDALNDITVANIIAGVADGSYDLQEMMRVIFAACAGKSTGGGTA
ncbi:MAG: hypothetical protein GWN00_12515, partial [Aliifodinibius sp.]|nr:hypothetical protein [Phycisphaerae bacterium]NIT57016.1 hypothetical protein [Fodinibius sp.]NIW43523.1 hypothetical protein [Gammaproteobacteria bacterium]NIW97863.1 hypothetical protein [Phycisphaerae bacterium]NIY25599.1 hypothetical protein [Fodinibius sp.]